MNKPGREFKGITLFEMEAVITNGRKVVARQSLGHLPSHLIKFALETGTKIVRSISSAL